MKTGKYIGQIFFYKWPDKSTTSYASLDFESDIKFL